MANFEEHLAGGAILGFIILLFLSGKSGINPEFEDLILIVAISAFGSMIPDALEPPTSAYHRSFFHSFVILFGLGFVTLTVLENINSIGISAIITFAAVGYLSHLSMDFFTPASLPLIA